MRRIAVLALAATLAGCATTGASDPRDPMEGFNRGVWGFNQALDKAAIKPATQVYRAVTPKPARRGLSRVIANLFEPLNAINSLLQGKPDRAMNSLGRFLVNTTIGVGGLADHASELGLPPTEEDFGQTLAVWGVKNSSYLVLPILGPSTIRDGIGTGVEFLVDPVNIGLEEAGASGELEWGVTGLRVLNSRSDAIDAGVDSLLETSADPYATARDAYFQRRAAQIANRGEGTLSDEEQEQMLNRALEESLEGDTGAAPDATPAGPDATESESPDAAAATSSEAPRLSLVMPVDAGIDD